MSNSVTIEILRLLRKQRSGAGAQWLYEQLAEMVSSQASFKVLLSNLVVKGLVRTDGKMKCGSCCREHTCYRIDERGRVKVASYD